MGGCWRAVTVLIVLLWTIGGLPASRGRSTGDHTDDSSSVHGFVQRRFEATLTPSDAGPDDDDAWVSVGPERVTAFVVVALVPPASTAGFRLASTNVARPGSPRGPPWLG